MPTWTTLTLAFLLSLPAAASRGGSASVCDTDADCASQEDGDLCNGTLYCDQDTRSCVVNPATVVTCATVADTQCLENTCWPTTGECGEDLDCYTGDPCNPGYCELATGTCKDFPPVPACPE